MNKQISISVRLAPIDKRCRYWAKIVRAEQGLPKPNAVDGASDLPQPFSRQGDEELFPGDVLIQGEELHRSRNYGWGYWITWIDDRGEKWTVRPDSDTKADLKAQGLEPALLPGAGQLAACVRCAHALRAGLRVEGHGMLLPESLEATEAAEASDEDAVIAESKMYA